MAGGSSRANTATISTSGIAAAKTGPAGTLNTGAIVAGRRGTAAVANSRRAD